MHGGSIRRRIRRICLPAQRAAKRQTVIGLVVVGRLAARCLDTDGGIRARLPARLQPPEALASTGQRQARPRGHRPMATRGAEPVAHLRLQTRPGTEPVLFSEASRIAKRPQPVDPARCGTPGGGDSEGETALRDARVDADRARGAPFLIPGLIVRDEAPRRRFDAEAGARVADRAPQFEAGAGIRVAGIVPHTDFDRGSRRPVFVRELPRG